MFAERRIKQLRDGIRVHDNVHGALGTATITDPQHDRAPTKSRELVGADLRLVLLDSPANAVRGQAIGPSRRSNAEPGPVLDLTLEHSDRGLGEGCVPYEEPTPRPSSPIRNPRSKIGRNHPSLAVRLGHDSNAAQ